MAYSTISLKGVVESVARLEKGGVKVLMVTGDSKETAVAIARRCGILGGMAVPTKDTTGDICEVGTIATRSMSVEDSSDDEFLDLEERHPSSHNPVDDLEYGAGLALSGSQLDAIGPHNLPGECYRSIY